MRAIAVVVCASLAGCASGTVAGGSPSMEVTRVSSGNAAMTTTTHPTINANGATVPFALDRAWSVLRFVYDSLEIPVATVDPSNHVVGNPDLKLRRRLGSIGLSRYIDCGNTQGSPSAETYEIRLSVFTQAQAATPASTSVLTTVEARGRPITMSGEYTLCTSTGVLERRIVELVAARLK